MPNLSILLVPGILLLEIVFIGVILLAAQTFAKTLFDANRARGQQRLSANVRVENGAISDDSSPLLRGMGGPGILTVDEHSAAALDKFGHFTRVVGGGYYLLQRFERVRGAVDLRRRVRKGSSKAYTRDGIPVAYDIEIEFRVLPAADSPKAPAKSGAGKPAHEPLHPFSFSPDAVWQAVYTLPVLDDGQVQDWGNGLLRSGIAEIDAFIATHDFYELSMEPAAGSFPARSEMSVRRRIQRQAEAAAAAALRGNGAELLALRLSSFNFDEPEAAGILDQRFADWKTYWENEALKPRRDGDTEAFKAREAARAEAQRAMLVLMAESLKAMATMRAEADKVLWLRIIESLEHMALDSSSYRFVPQEIFSLIQNLRNIAATGSQEPASAAPSLPAAVTPSLPAAVTPSLPAAPAS